MKEIVNTLVTIATIVVTFGPLVIYAIRYVGVKTKSRQLLLLADRASIIVMALDNLKITNNEKQKLAIAKLVDFANEVSIPLTNDQAGDYIDSAVREMRVNYGEEK